MTSTLRNAWMCAVLLLFALPASAQVNRRWVALNFDGAGLDTTAVGMADSTQIVSTGNAARAYLRLKPSRPCRIAIAITVYGGPDSASVTLGDSTNVSIWPWRGFNAASADTMTMTEPTVPTSVQAGSHEFVYEFPAQAAGKWGSPRGRDIALRGTDGAWLTAKMIRVRVRVLTAGGVVTWSGSSYEAWSW